MTNNEFLLKYLTTGEYAKFITGGIEHSPGGREFFLGRLENHLPIGIDEYYNPISYLFGWPEEDVGYWQEITIRCYVEYCADNKSLVKKQIVKLNV